MAGTFTIGAAHAGVLIDVGPGRLVAIGYQKRPLGSEQPEFDPSGLPRRGYFCLVDRVDGASPRQLFSVDLHTNPVCLPIAGSENNMLSLPDGIPFFGSLLVQCCPRGACFSVTTVAVEPLKPEDLPTVAIPVRGQSIDEQLRHAREQQQIQAWYPTRQAKAPTRPR
jgi:hypothetical protein